MPAPLTPHQKAAKLVAAGHTTREAGEATGLSRNAVIGYIWRIENGERGRIQRAAQWRARYKNDPIFRKQHKARSLASYHALRALK